jgi:hypothetical protein
VRSAILALSLLSSVALAAPPVRVTGYAEADAAALDSTGIVEGEHTYIKTSLEGRLLVDGSHPNRFRCTVAVSTATTLTAVGGSCAAPGASLSLYVTDILFASNAQAIAADAFPTLKYGTGGTCGSGTTVFWGAFQPAATQATTVQRFVTPLKIPANNEICWINSTAGSKFIVLSGYIAP